MINSVLEMRIVVAKGEQWLHKVDSWGLIVGPGIRIEIVFWRCRWRNLNSHGGLVAAHGCVCVLLCKKMDRVLVKKWDSEVREIETDILYVHGG